MERDDRQCHSSTASHADPQPDIHRELKAVGVC